MADSTPAVSPHVESVEISGNTDAEIGHSLIALGQSYLKEGKSNKSMPTASRERRMSKTTKERVLRVVGAVALLQASFSGTNFMLEGGDISAANPVTHSVLVEGPHDVVNVYDATVSVAKGVSKVFNTASKITGILG